MGAAKWLVRSMTVDQFADQSVVVVVCMSLVLYQLV